uniref:Uncharacterized protein n=1 Tax=Lepeophtheirus salmonis TaxID=72036 RepID=A0A0K2T2P1_LEPSM
MEDKKEINKDTGKNSYDVDPQFYITNTF